MGAYKQVNGSSKSDRIYHACEQVLAWGTWRGDSMGHPPGWKLQAVFVIVACCHCGNLDSVGCALTSSATESVGTVFLNTVKWT